MHSVILLVLVSLFSANGQAPGSKWKVSKTEDPMTDKVTTTLVLESDEGLASIRISCADDGKPSGLFTLPGDVIIGGKLTVAEIRFDKNEPRAFTFEHLNIPALVTALGGVAKATNLMPVSGSADDLQKVVGSGRFERAQVAAASQDLIDGLAGASKVAYRFWVAQSGSGLSGSFSPRGFAAVSKHLAPCGPSQ